MRPECPTVCVVGLGYIGLPTAALIASRGLDVIGVDVDLQVVATVGAGRVHIIEADLELLVQKSVRSGRLIASSFDHHDANRYLNPDPRHPLTG